MKESDTACTTVAVSGLNHVNLTTDDIERTAQFYCELLDLDLRMPATSLPTGFSRWLCDATGAAIIHLRRAADASAGTGAVDHVALNCSGKEAIIERLVRSKTPFGRYDGLVPGMTQLFVTGPHDVRLELIFIDE